MRIIKWLILIAIIVAIWKFVIPSAKEKFGGPPGTAGTSRCGTSAEFATNAWGDGVARFTNPPYDIAAWTTFTSEMDTRIATAEAECKCGSPSCEKANGALRDLRGLISDMDSAIRTGTAPPADLVERQESIDNRIAEARAGEIVK